MQCVDINKYEKSEREIIQKINAFFIEMQLLPRVILIVIGLVTNTYVYLWDWKKEIK